VLRTLPVEWSKYAGIGFSVLITGLIAAISSGYATYLASGSLLFAFILGTFWGVMIFNLDRYIVLSLTKYENIESKTTALTAQLVNIIPRLILAILISLVISRPLVMAIFRQPIQQQIYLSQRASIEDVIRKVAAKESEISSLEERSKFESNKINKLMEAYFTEVKGVPGPNSTGRPGLGPVAAQRRAAYELAEKEFLDNKAKIDEELVQKRAELAASINQQADLQRVLQTSQTNFAAQLNAFSDLAKNDHRVALINYFILLLIIFLETSPLLVKLLSPAGPYDAMLKHLSRDAKGDALLQTDRVNADLQQAISGSLDKSFLNPRREKSKP
jgi:hypothetical protein